MTLHHYQVSELPDRKQRLDLWLVQQMPQVSRSQLQRWIEQGQVRVNDQGCTAKKYEIQEGDVIQVLVPEPKALDLQPEAIALDILYEDDQMLIVNKPVGMVVHPSPGHDHGTLVHALLAHCTEAGTPSLSGIGGVQRPGIVHRLDKDTSGAIVVAKTDIAHQHLQAQIAAKTARREYLAIVYGKPPTPSGTIDQPIGRHPRDRKRMAIVPETAGGRRAITHWQIRERLGNYTLMHFQLETGRTHQIRVHAADQGWPIVGDPLYSRGRSVGVNIKGQALHAWRLQVQHPQTQDWIKVEAPLPQRFMRLLQVLQQRPG
ncbi:RluA family pseudouridine synthase [Synechococcales cyanobacterium C]|uniref:Pseudouridine synthase n=1 Tax=Petrachloros mirabilis ULC683 TaxID=2781853 RepID=A0A8K2A8S9_9CYAN|nr:RluA family pseudouridine synthase [Petrachloros mirabilis]NCJ07250.1 RluA family pseudouridine synthase [Petrachloros mirabilis ULC683]